jgi:hypothetical protein
MIFPVSASSLNYVTCPRAINMKRQGIPAEVPSDDDLLLFGVDIHAIFDAINRHRGPLRLDDSQLDAIIANNISDPESINALRYTAIRYIETFPISQIVFSEVNLAVDKNGYPCDYDAPEAMIRGRIDVVLDSADGSHRIILDHKSGWAVYDANTFQNRLYAYLWKKNFPETQELGLAIHFSRKNVIKYSDRMVTNFVAVEKEVMIAAKKAWDTPESSDPCPGKACQYCNWCMSCPAVKDGIVMLVDPAQATQFAKEVVVLERRMSTIKKQLKAYIERFGNIDIDDAMYYGVELGDKYTVKVQEVLDKLSQFPSLIEYISIVDVAGLVDHPANLDIQIVPGRQEYKMRKKKNEETSCTT